MNQTNNPTLTFEDLVAFFWRWRKKLILLSIVIVVLSSVFSSPFFIKPKYKSTVIFYPTTTNSISKALLPEVGQKAADVLEFGAEEEAEKALQILQSSKLRNKLINQFNLMKHYKINSKKDSYPMLKLERKMESNFNVSRTRYLSIRIDVMDEDPKKAADFATGMANLYDTIKTEIHRERALEALEIVGRANMNKEMMIQGLHKQMQELGQSGVTNYEEQSKAIQEAMINASRLGSSPQVLNDLIMQQENLVKFGGLYLSIVDKIKLEEEKLSDIRAKYDRAKIDVEENMTHKFMVSDAYPAEKKSYPVRWLIVVVSLFSGLTIASFIFALIEKLNKIKLEKEQATVQP
jgi:uncharacterized protein involved in exopolysaccharide biosynthesis